ncbi:Pre-mRNA-splicing factor spp2 [Ancistrocladus abbreviatus]
MSVGTEIAYGDSFLPDHEWEQLLSRNWDRNIVTEETAKFPELVPQSETEQRPHKVSFFVEKNKASDVIKALRERLEQRGLDIKIIYSGGVALDVLPQRGGKGQALAYLMKKFEADGRIPANTLVCGDSGNDAELFSVPKVYGVMVSNAQEELLEWHKENATNNNSIIHASERCAAGIIQAIGHFQLGPYLSPRDISDLLKSTENMNPGFQVVKLYLFYERWRRAEVDKSDHFIEKLKSDFYPSGIYVHPCGGEKPLHDCLVTLGKSYGDKRGQGFRVWLDRVSSAQIGSDTWLVKFDKCELSGLEHRCCLTTVLLNSKPPEGFTWMHLHQTWLNGAGAEDSSDWLF